MDFQATPPDLQLPSDQRILEEEEEEVGVFPQNNSPAILQLKVKLQCVVHTKNTVL